MNSHRLHNGSTGHKCPFVLVFHQNFVLQLTFQDEVRLSYLLCSIVNMGYRSKGHTKCSSSEKSRRQDGAMTHINFNEHAYWSITNASASTPFRRYCATVCQTNIRSTYVTHVNGLNAPLEVLPQLLVTYHEQRCPYTSFVIVKTAKACQITRQRSKRKFDHCGKLVPNWHYAILAGTLQTMRDT